VVEALASRRIPLPAERIRPLAGDGARLAALFALVRESGDGTLVTVTGRQLPAAAWEERLEAARPATIRMLEESLAALRRAAGAGAPG
jgi:hypothetical protein